MVKNLAFTQFREKRFSERAGSHQDTLVVFFSDQFAKRLQNVLQSSNSVLLSSFSSCFASRISLRVLLA